MYEVNNCKDIYLSCEELYKEHNGDLHFWQHDTTWLECRYDYIKEL